MTADIMRFTITSNDLIETKEKDGEIKLQIK